MVNIIINVSVITMNKNKDIIENGVVAFLDNKIIYVGDSFKEVTKNYKDFTIIDGNNGILIPGMVNCHTHISMVVFRSLADDYKDRLKRYLFPLEKVLVDEKLTYIGAKYGICEMLLGGVTTFCDMYYFEDEVAKASKDLNIRGILLETVVDFISPDSDKDFGGIDYGKKFIKKWKNDNLIKVGLAPHAPYTNTSESLKECFAISKENNTLMSMHVAEMDYEFDECIKKYNMTPVEYLNSLGILDNNFISAHTVLVNDKDISILKEKNVGISHNIGANAKGAKGVMPILKMIDKGLNIGLGTDGPMSGNTLDIITQMPQVAKIHKLFNNDRSVLPCDKILEMATIGGARVLNMENEIGSIEVGKKADLVLIETDSVNMQPIYDYYSTIVYSANPSNVSMVIVDGKVVVKDKKLISGDFNEIRKDLINLKEDILKVANTL